MDFGPVRAVDNVDFTVEPSEIIGLLGENGAGKSTLMNVLAASFPATKGKIFIDGKEVHMANAKQSTKHGIRFIHQELNLCKDLLVYENMFLGEELTKGMLFLNKVEMKRRASEIFERMSVNIRLDVRMEELQPAEKQLVEIAKALLFKSDLIIMDEPSTALSNKEVEHLFVIMRQLKAEGVSFIYISHKMPELFEICDIYYVMRDGKIVARGAFTDVNEQQITELMIGRNLSNEDFDDKDYYGTDEVALSVKGLCGFRFKDISFDLHKGEIIAITGLQGSGRDTFADALFGAEKYVGEIIVNGKPMRKKDSIIKRMKSGIAMVPRSRKERGIYNDLSIYDNTSMGYLNTKHKKLLISKKLESERFEREKKAMSIKTDYPKNPITSLSGGNQQKVILGRWLETDANIFIFDNPTQGIDVGTKFEIYHLILQLAQQGKAIIVLSTEYPEIFKVADSCLVMYKGEIQARLERNEITEKNLMYYSTGANLEGGKNVC